MSVTGCRREGRTGNERGAITLTVALGMTVLLSSAAIAIDLGRVMVARTESQRVADLAALAGAGAYIQSAAPNINVAVEAWSLDFASRNTVDGVAVTLPGGDVLANVVDERVSVTVAHTKARGNAIGTVFGGVVGFGSVDIVTTAIVEAAPASAVYCALPLYLVDRWNELGGSPDRFDPGIDYYEAYNPAAPTSTYTGYDRSHVGLSLLIDPAGATPADAGRPMATWYFPFGSGALPGGPGSYRLSIESCLDPARLYDLGADIPADPTPMPLATVLGFQTLVNQDPSAAWDPGLLCVVDASALGLGDPSNCRASPRLRPIVLLDPSQAPGSTPQNGPVRNLAGIFVGDVLGSEVAIYLTGYTGVRAARASGGGFIPPLVRTLRIIG